MEYNEWKDNLSKNFTLSSNECLFLIIISPKDIVKKQNYFQSILRKRKLLYIFELSTYIINIYTVELLIEEKEIADACV